MASVTWDSGFEATPAGGDNPKYGDDVIRELKVATRERANLEHSWLGGDGWHRPGSAKAYNQATEPTTRPDGTTPLDSDDAGRLWWKNDASDESLHLWNGSEHRRLLPVVKEVHEITDATDVTVTLPDATKEYVERIYWRTGSGSGKLLFATTASQTINGNPPSNYYLVGEDSIHLAPVDGNWRIVTSGSGGSGSEIDGVLGETVSQNDIVYFATDGKLYKATKADLSKCYVAGVAKNGGSAGDSIKVIKSGQVDTFSSLTAGEQYFLGDDGGIVTSGNIDYFDNKVLIGTAIDSTTLDLSIGPPQYRENKDDGLPIGSIIFSANETTIPGYLQFAYNNAVSIANYPVLYSVVGKKFEKIHTDAGDPATDADHFYPTPIPGYFPRPSVPDSADIDSTSAIDITNDTITLSAGDYNTLRRSRDPSAANPHGVPILLSLQSGALPTGLAEDTVYYIRFVDDTSYLIKLYTSETNAISDTSPVDITATATGTFKLTQAGIYQQDAVGDHWHAVAGATTSGGVNGADGFMRGTTNDPKFRSARLSERESAYEGYFGDGSTSPTQQNRWSNETRPNEVFLFGYIKAEYITPAGEPVSALRYDTGWQNFWASDIRGSSVDISHNLDSESSELICIFSIKVIATGDILTPVIVTRAWDQATSADADYIYGAEFVHVNNNTSRLRIGTSGLIVLGADGSEQQITSNGSDFQYRVIIIKPSLIATYTDAPIRAKFEITDATDQVVALPDANGQTAERTYWRTGSGTGKVTFTTYGSQTINGDSASVWYLEGEGVIKLAPVNGNWEVVEYYDKGGNDDKWWVKTIDGHIIYYTWDYIQGDGSSTIMNKEVSFSGLFPYNSITAIEGEIFGLKQTAPTTRMDVTDGTAAGQRFNVGFGYTDNTKYRIQLVSSDGSSALGTDYYCTNIRIHGTWK